MKVILIALLYSSPASPPFVKVADFVYEDIQMCYRDAEFAKVMLMEGAPSKESFVDTYCVVLPEDA